MGRAKGNVTKVKMSKAVSTTASKLWATDTTWCISRRPRPAEALIPFHALPKAHALLRDHIVNVSDGHVTVHRKVLGEWMDAQHEALVKAAALQGARTRA